MRPLIASVLCMLAASASCAQTPLEDCTEVPELAADVMTSRQRNADIMLMINKMNSEFNDHPELLGWAQSMIDMAYAEPVPLAPEARARQVQDFQTLWNERCLARRP